MDTSTGGAIETRSEPQDGRAADPVAVAGGNPKRRALVWAVGALAAVALVDQLLVAFRFGRHYVIEDQTILWYAAREWGAGVVRGPYYTGQLYGSTFEALPLAALRWIGIAPNVALPLILSALGVAPWLVLAGIFVRRGRPLTALSAVAVPLLMSTYYSQYVSFYGAGTGRFLAGMALVAIVGFPNGRAAFGIACGLGSFAAVVDPSALLLVAPVLAFGFLRSPELKQAAAGLIGLVPTGLWLVYQRWFVSAFPDYDLHPSPSGLHVATLGRTLGHPSRYWQMFAPDLLHSWIVPLGLGIVLVGLLGATLRPQYFVPALLAVVVVLLGLSTERAEDGPSPLLPYARLFLLIPLTLWFLAFLVYESGVLGQRRRLIGVGVVLALVLGVSTVVVRQASLDGRNRDLIAAAARAPFVFPVLASDALNARCDRMSQLTHDNHIDLAVFTVDRASAYGCGAASYGKLRTLFPSYERRTWLLHDEARRERTQLIVAGVLGDWCDANRRFTTTCTLVPLSTPAEGDAAIVTFPSQSAVTFLRHAGVDIRPFGAGCHPQKPATCRDH